MLHKLLLATFKVILWVLLGIFLSFCLYTVNHLVITQSIIPERARPDLLDITQRALQITVGNPTMSN